MIKNLKKIAIALALAGATSASVYAQPTYTNVLRNLSFNLTCYQQYVYGASTPYGTAATGGTNSADTKITYHSFTLTTKDIINGILASPGISSSAIGADPQLVLATLYTNVPNYVNPIVSNGAATNAALSSNGVTVTIASLSIGGYSIPTNFIATTNYYLTNSPYGGYLYVGNGIETDTNGDATNAYSLFPIATNVITLVNGGIITNIVFDTNAYSTVLFSAGTSNGSITNISLTASNSTVTNVFEPYNSYVYLAGKAGSTNVNNLITFVPSGYVVTNVTGKNLGTNPPIATFASGSFVEQVSSSLGVFTTSGFSTSNLSLTLNGLAKGTLKLDTFIPKKGTSSATTEFVNAASATATVYGSGYIGGAYITNRYVGSPGTVGLPATISNPGTNTPIIGAITNSVPIVAEGNITLTFLKNASTP